jgi:hypothetical protein
MKAYCRKYEDRVISDRDWVCPYCGVIAYEGENKLRHLAKHEPAIAKMLRENFRLRVMLSLGVKLDEE